MPISILHWKMVSLILNGAISYARLWYRVISYTATLLMNTGETITHIAEPFKSPAGCAVHSQPGCPDMRRCS